jgi:hypothetical protein
MHHHLFLALTAIKQNNMKKKLLYIILALSAFITSCKKDEDPIFEDPDTRLSAALAENQAQLINAPNGWKATIYPHGGKGFTYYFKFTADGKVTMLSDFNATTATKPAESTYRLKALQRPTLIFDTYNYVHLAADPDAGVSGGANARGLTSDFEFGFVSAAGDSLKMEGTFNFNQMVMVKLSADESQKILAGGLKTMTDANTAYLTANKNPYIQLDANVRGALLIDPVAKTVKLNYLDDKEASLLQTVSFAYGIGKLVLSNYITYGSIRFNELLWDAATNTYYAMSGGTRINVLNSALPIIPLRALFAPVGKDYSQIDYNPASVNTSLSTDFSTRYNTAKTGLAAVGGAGRMLDYVKVMINTDNTMVLRFYYRNTAGSAFQANFTYSYTRTAAGVFTFTYLGADGNGTVVGPGFVALTDYFRNNTFTIDWISNPSGGYYGGLVTTSNPASFYYGTLIK